MAPGDEQSGEDPQGKPRTDQTHPLQQDHVQDLATLGAERHPHPDLLGALAHRKGQDSGQSG